MGKNLSTRLSMGFAVIVLATVALVSLLANLLINRQFERYVERQQKEFADDLAVSLGDQYEAGSGQWNPDYIHGFGMYALNDGYIIRLYDKNGDIVWDAQNHDMTLCHQIMSSILLRIQEQKPEAKEELVTQRYELTCGHVLVGYADISYYSPYVFDDSDFQFIEALNRILGAVAAVCLAAAVLAGLVLARRISRPIEKAMEITGQISRGNYGIRVEAQTPIRELQALILSVNSMAEALEKQEKLRGRLARDVAHELRTPLANVAAHLEAMLEGVWEPTAERLQGCYDEIGRIGGIVSDLEKLEEIEYESTKLNKTPVNLYGLCEAVLASFEAEFLAKGITCRLDGGNTVVMGDEKRLRQVMDNLLSNAVKYSCEGGRISVRLAKLETEVHVTVEDEGIGIAQEELSLIFERFYRTDRSRSRKTGGAGIGLAIAKSIVEAHGGSITAESRVGQGSRFTVRLPVSGSVDANRTGDCLRAAEMNETGKN